MEEFLNSQSCACRELTERVIIAIVTRHHMCAHIFVLCRLGVYLVSNSTQQMLISKEAEDKHGSSTGR